MRERRFIRGCAVDAGKSRPASAQRARYCFIHELTGRNRPGASAAALFSAAIDRGPVGRVARALRAVSRRGHPPLRMRRPVAIPALPAVVALPETEEQVQAVMRICKRLNAGGRARRRHRPVRRRHAAQPGRAAGSVRSIASAASIWPAPPPWSSPACATWRFPKRPLLRFVLCARSLQPDRLFHWRQRGREFRRRALPEVRPDRAQRAARAWSPSTATSSNWLRGAGRAGPGSAVGVHRFGRHAGRGHRGDGQAHSRRPARRS